MSSVARSSQSLPFRIEVSKVVSSRYDDSGVLQQIESDRDFSSSLKRPASWDLRRNGVDLVIDQEGREFRLYSDGGQSVPEPGWILLLTGLNSDKEYLWTLYGMSR